MFKKKQATTTETLPLIPRKTLNYPLSVFEADMWNGKGEKFKKIILAENLSEATAKVMKFIEDNAFKSAIDEDGIEFTLGGYYSVHGIKNIGGLLPEGTVTYIVG